MQYFLVIITVTYDTSVYTMNHPDCIVCRFMESSIGLKKGKFRVKSGIFGQTAQF